MVAVIVFIVCLFHLLAPRVAWTLHIGWKLKGAQPSDTYLALVRIGGGIGCVATAIIIVVAFINAPRSTSSNTWLHTTETKLIAQDVLKVSVGTGIPSDHLLSKQQIDTFVPEIQNDISKAVSLGGTQSVNSYNQEIDITFTDGTGIKIYELTDRGTFEFGPSQNNDSAQYSFQDFGLTKKLQTTMLK